MQAHQANPPRAISRPFATALFLVMSCAALHADVLVHADGKRETVEQARKDAQGHWSYDVDGRHATLRPGEVVAVIDAKGKEWVTILELSDSAETPGMSAAWTALKDKRSEVWFSMTQDLCQPPTRVVHEKLVTLSTDKDKDLRVRAVSCLCALRTKASIVAATRAVLAEKDASTRRGSASALTGVREILRRCDEVHDLIQTGISDKDAVVRFLFASISPLGTEGAIQILIADGLHSSDHHVREETALELARRGDASGESVLIQLLTRKTIPGIHDEPELVERLLTAEQVDICGLLADLGSPAARAALEKAKSSSFEAVRIAAAAALARIAG